MEQHLWYDVVNRQLVSGPQNSEPLNSLPDVFQGDSLRLVLHGLAPNDSIFSNVPYVEAPITYTQIKAAIGMGPDAVPTGGTYRLRIVGDTEANATIAMPFNTPQADVLTALNALAVVQNRGGVRLDSQAIAATNFFIIRWNDPGITLQFEIFENRLEPLCFVRTYVYAAASGQVQVLKFIVAPLAFTDQFAYPISGPVVVTGIRAGTTAQNCIQSVTIPTTATGSFTLKFNTNATTLLPCSAYNTSTDASAQLAAALNGIYSDTQVRFNVTRSATGIYYVECVGPLAKQVVALFGVEMFDQEPVNTPAASLALNGVSIELALHGSPKQTFVFELEITDGNGTTTAVQRSITIINDMIDSAMAIGADPNWLVPADPSYPPYDPAGQTIMAPGAYVTPVGSGTGQGTGGTSYVVTHNLGTLNCIVEVRETGGTHHRLPDNTYVTTYLNTNQIQVDFATAPTNGQYFIIIAAVIPAALALPYHTQSIASIIGLQDILTALQNGIDPTKPIDAKSLPAHIPWYNSDTLGNPTTSKFDPLPDALLPDDVLRKPLQGSDLPPGVPYYDVGPPAGIYVTLPGPPPQTILIISTDPAPPHIPIELLPLGDLLDALLAGGLPPNTVVIEISDMAESFPPLFELTSHCGEDSDVPTVFSSVLPALANTTLAGAISGGLPPPGTAGYVGKRFTVQGSAYSSATVFREGQKFYDGDVVASNGYHWFKVTVNGSLAYPKEYERELFSFYISPDMLAKGSRFSLDFTLQAQMLSPDLVRGQYLLTLEIGTPQGVTGSGIGQNLSGVNWYSQIVQEVLILSNANVYHHFKYGVDCDKTTGAYTATKGLYASTGLTAAAPIASGFAVRATLSQFDVENFDPNPSGQVNLKMVKAIAAVVKLNS